MKDIDQRMEIAAERIEHLFLKKRLPTGSIAKINRNTGQPHEHAREISRHRRQQGVA